MFLIFVKFPKLYRKLVVVHDEASVWHSYFVNLKLIVTYLLNIIEEEEEAIFFSLELKPFLLL